MTAISGQKTVTAAGTAEALGTASIQGPLMIKALLGNGDNVYIGNDGSGDVTSANGFELDAGEAIVFDFVGNLGSIMVDSDANGEGVAWLRLNL